MRLQSINVGMPAIVDMGFGPEETAIYKTAVEGPVRVSQHGLAGNEVANDEHHGGVDQAIYVYFAADYSHFEQLLERDLAPGTFGENLTIDHDDSDEIGSADCWIGDRIHIGDVELEVTAPRIPCGVFARRMALTKDFPRQFRDQHRPGVYGRVLTEGEVTVGDRVSIEPGDRNLSVVELVQLWGTRPAPDVIDRVLAAPIAERTRRDYERKRRAAVES